MFSGITRRNTVTHLGQTTKRRSQSDSYVAVRPADSIWNYLPLLVTGAKMLGILEIKKHQGFTEPCGFIFFILMNTGSPNYILFGMYVPERFD